MIRDLKGQIIAADDNEILAAQKLLAEYEGIFCLPASATVLAGLLKLHAGRTFRRDDRIAPRAAGWVWRVRSRSRIPRSPSSPWRRWNPRNPRSVPDGARPRIRSITLRIIRIHIPDPQEASRSFRKILSAYPAPRRPRSAWWREGGKRRVSDERAWEHWRAGAPGPRRRLARCRACRVPAKAAQGVSC